MWPYSSYITLPADLICAQRTRVLTTRREYARRLVPDGFRLPPRTHGTNQLPADIRAISTVSTFKQHLKTHLFNIAYLYYPRDAMLARVIEIATCLSVRPSVGLSVRHAPVLCQNEES